MHLIRKRNSNSTTLVRTHVRLNSPVEVKVRQTRMLVKESTIPSAHVTIRDHPSFAYSDGTEILKAVHETTVVNPVRERPMGRRNDFIIAVSTSNVRGGMLPWLSLGFAGNVIIDAP